MKTSKICSILWVNLLFISMVSSASAQETLKEILEKNKWEKIIGTWVDEGTKGQAIETTYAWKIKDRVIEIVTKEGKNKEVALMGVNAKTGDVFHMGAKSDGSSSLGTWKFSKTGDATLGVAFTDGNGQQGGIEIRFEWLDDNSMTLTIGLPDPIDIEMVRKKKSR